jgi:predicted amino acid-binding ACT domain protein
MADKASIAPYAYVVVPDRPGEGAKVLAALRKAGVNLLAYNAFPAGRGRSQIDLVPKKMGKLRRLARSEGWKLSREKACILISGRDRVGALADSIAKLARKKINVVAGQASQAGRGRFGCVLWVPPAAAEKAARALGAR